MPVDKKIAIIADVHGNRWALEAVLKDIESRGIQDIVNLGDCLYGPLDPAGTARILMQRDMPTVRGNEDRIILEPAEKSGNSPTLDYVKKNVKPRHLEWLETLALTTVVYEDIFLCHGSPDRDDEYLPVTVSAKEVSVRTSQELAAKLSAHKESVFLCGHDHVPRTIYLPEEKLIVNPGSVGLPAYSDDLPFPHAMETHTPHARYSIIHKNKWGWQVENIAAPYDWQSAADAALKNRRPDWAKWLKTGRAYD